MACASVLGHMSNALTLIALCNIEILVKELDNTVYIAQDHFFLDEMVALL